jgi:hypothetical protein
MASATMVTPKPHQRTMQQFSGLHCADAYGLVLTECKTFAMVLHHAEHGTTVEGRHLLGKVELRLSEA